MDLCQNASFIFDDFLSKRHTIPFDFLHSFPFYDNIVYCRYADSALPTTFIGLEKWLQELWRDKDQLLETVYKGQAHHMFSRFLNLPIYEF